MDKDKLEKDTNIEKIDLKEYDLRVESLKEDLKKLKKIKRRKKKLRELEKEREGILRAINKKHK